MPIKYVAFFVFLWVVGSLLGAIITMANVPLNTPQGNETGVMADLTQLRQITSDESFGLWSIPALGWNFTKAIYHTMTWEFPFLPNNSMWFYFKCVVLIPLTALAVYGLAITFLGIFQKVL